MENGHCEIERASPITEGVKVPPNKVDAFDPPTLGFYSREAPTYVASGRGGASRHLPAFLQLLRPYSQILELGCGGGVDARAMLDQGFEIDPTDGAPEIVAKARERIGRPVRVMRFEELDASEKYDAVWAHASLLHVPRAGLRAVINRLFRALRPGGYHFANFKGGGTEGRDRFGRYFNYLTMSQLLDVYRASAPWEIVTTDEYLGGGYEGGQGPWVAITVRKPLP